MVERKTIAVMLITVAILAASAFAASLSVQTQVSSTSTSAESSIAPHSTGVWTTYHGYNNRSGFVHSTAVTRASLAWRSVQLDGKAYAEPLIYGGRLFVATENDTVYALNASKGSILWRQNLGTPVRGSDLPCGDIDPSGITSTPAIDANSGTLYVVAFLKPAHHVLSALRLTDGSVRFSLAVDPPGSNPMVEQQRAALTLANGMVYVPYGGLQGDCGQYHGWVVGAHADGSPSLASYMVPTQREGGIWAPSGAAADSAGHIFVATGNGQSSTVFDHGNSVITLASNLSELGFFAPSNWASLNSRDTDLGSVGPAMVGGSTLFQIGKEGVAYLLNANNLVGIGGETSSLKVCGSAFGGTASDGSAVYVACSGGLFQVRLAGGTMQLGWSAGGIQAGPPVVAGGVVWTVDPPSGRLLGYSASDGAQLFSFQIGPTSRFTTPTASPSAIFVATNEYVYAISTG